MVILDSNILVAYANEDDQDHKASVQVLKRIEDEHRGEAMVSELVFSEIMNVILLKLKKKTVAQELGSVILKTYRIRILDLHDFEYAFEIFKSQKGTNLSFVDASLIAMAKSYGMKVATFDKELRKALGSSAF